MLENKQNIHQISKKTELFSSFNTLEQIHLLNLANDYLWNVGIIHFIFVNSLFFW